MIYYFSLFSNFVAKPWYRNGDPEIFLINLYVLFSCIN